MFTDIYKDSFCSIKELCHEEVKSMILKDITKPVFR